MNENPEMLIREITTKEKKRMDIVDSDIATIEVLHDLLLDAHGYSLSFWALERARELTAKMYKALKEK